MGEKASTATATRIEPKKQFRILKPLLIFITASGTVRNLASRESQTSLQLSPSRFVGSDALDFGVL